MLESGGKSSSSQHQPCLSHVLIHTHTQTSVHSRDRFLVIVMLFGYFEETLHRGFGGEGPVHATNPACVGCEVPSASPACILVFGPLGDKCTRTCAYT